MKTSPKVGIALAATIALGGLIQLVPYGRDHSNPKAGNRVAWNAPETEALARRACFDCHSNQTVWPWYASVAPISWRVQSHVDEGRETLNFSDFRAGDHNVTHAAGKASREVLHGDMPPADYLLAHPLARLNPAERKVLIEGLKATFAQFAKSKQDTDDDD